MFQHGLCKLHYLVSTNSPVIFRTLNLKPNKHEHKSLSSVINVQTSNLEPLFPYISALHSSGSWKCILGYVKFQKYSKMEDE
ncbi:hypothetical protein AQUCO_06200029v1 [Aquilegia coerulea]|uniref:Uncharacterized protein n=1 Tax=Aquilegia coerulea TaxID=218851 RepID=A0A2G5CD22_AQUCA|nr:hypothetical protein AQUCO_06200029v1 [Aquilegia coerulea]